MKRSIKPILVTGSHRSGTTWAGRMISAGPHVVYIHEPFNPNINAGLQPNPFRYWFQYVCDENSEEYDQIIDEIIDFKYPLSPERNFVSLKNKNMARTLMDWGSRAWHKTRGDRPLMKDPIALFSAEWLYKKYDMDVLILLRHPAAFCSSLKIINWEFDFNNFLEQDRLMENHLQSHADEIREFARNRKNVVEQAILLWNCIHEVIRTYREKYPEWLFIKHEDLSFDPIAGFKSVYKRFGLEFTSKARKIIHDTSGVHNPVEQLPGYEFTRNSRGNIKTWKNRLSQEEISLIRVKTSQVADLFYDEASW